MRKLLPLLLTAALLLSCLTSCFVIPDVDGYLDDVISQNRGEDLDKLINGVAHDAVLSGVIVSATHYSGFQKKESQGSGVIYRLYDRYFYVLTNYHVVYNNGSNLNTVYTVTDAFDTAHNATLVAADESLDLAVVRFVATSDDIERLKIATLATKDPSVSTVVLSVGNPGGLHNAISLGDILSYNDVGLDSLSIPVMYHTAPVDHGSSGGGVYDTDGLLVGINYALGQSEDGEATMSFAVPIGYVREFLLANGILPTERDESEDQN